MFDNAGLLLLSIITLCVPIFGLIIYYGLKSRQYDIDQWIKDTNAQLVQSKMSDKKLDISSLLYGNFYDSSPSVVTLMIKDRNDIIVGKAVYDIGSITIEAGKEKFRVFNEGNSHFHITVRPLKGKGSLEPQIAECVSRGIFSKRFQYYFPNIGKIEVRHRYFCQQAPVLKDGFVIGEWFRLGPYELSGKALVLSVDIPLIFQMIILSGPFTRRLYVSY